jgi:predicted signal transduction protein with EAL and GGDEF domain
MIADVREVGDKKYAGRFQIGVSIGIATYPDRTDTVEQLLDVADVAMYEAKKGGAVDIPLWSVHKAWRVQRRENDAVERELGVRRSGRNG